MIDYYLLISIIFLQDADHSSHVADFFAHLGRNASAQGISLLLIASN